MGDTRRRKDIAPRAGAHTGPVFTNDCLIRAANFRQKEGWRITDCDGTHAHSWGEKLRFLDHGGAHHVDHVIVTDADASAALLDERALIVIGVDEHSAAC